MDRQELLEHLLKTFLLELDEHLAVLSRGLLQLEAGAAGEARAATLDDLFRAAHSRARPFASLVLSLGGWSEHQERKQGERDPGG